MPQPNYYRVLQVDPEAEPEVIDAAYRRLARLYHPDVSKAPGAARKMQEINGAYEVLRDPQRRRQYDEYLKASRVDDSAHEQNQQAADKSTDWSSQSEANTFARPDFPVYCQRCGKSDATLRIAVFPYVVSFLILTFRRAWIGVFCLECRKHRMLMAKLLTFCLGWWGIPLGPIYTLAVLFKPSQGEIPRDANGPFLGALGAYFITRGQLGDAAQAWEASLQYQQDTRLEEVYQRLFLRRPNLTRKPSHGEGSGVAVGLAFLCLAIAAAFGSGVLELVPASEVRSVPTIAPRSTSMVPVATVRPRSTPTAAASWSRTELYANVSANFRAQIPVGYEVRANASGGDPPMYRVGIAPRGDAGPDDSFIIVETVALAQGVMVTRSQAEDLVQKYVNSRDGWSTIVNPTSSSDEGRVYAETVGQSELGDSVMARNHVMLISVPGWLYVIDVMGVAGYDGTTIQHYRAFTASFEPDPF